MENKQPVVSSDKLLVMVRNPEAVIFSGEVISLSSVNERGPFDILPMHENFISIITTSLVLRLPNGEKKEFQVDKGILRAYKNVVDIFLGVEALAPTDLASSLPQQKSMLTGKE